jgi:hypothetical protein
MATPTPDFLTELDAIDADATTLFALPANALIHTAGPGHWSALQCIEHLTLLNDAYIAAMDEGIRNARVKGRLATKPYYHPLIARLAIWATNPPARIKLPIPSARVSPPPTTDVEGVRNAYYANHRALQRCITDALEVDLHAPVRTPFVWRPRAALGTVIGVLLAHERRHLYQAKKAAGALKEQ